MGVSPRRQQHSQTQVANEVWARRALERSHSAPTYRPASNDLSGLRTKPDYQSRIDYRHVRQELPTPQRDAPHLRINDQRARARKLMSVATAGSAELRALPAEWKADWSTGKSGFIPYPETVTAPLHGPMAGYTGHEFAHRYKEGEQGLPMHVRLERRYDETIGREFRAPRGPPEPDYRMGFLAPHKPVYPNDDPANWGSYGWQDFPPRGLDLTISDLGIATNGVITRTTANKGYGHDGDHW